MPKQKMLMKRCQRESQEQGALLLGPSGLKAQQAPLATSWATPDPAGAAQLTANFGAPLVPPQLQVPAPFNAPPFAMPPHTLPQMPAGLPGQNSLQVPLFCLIPRSHNLAFLFCIICRGFNRRSWLRSGHQMLLECKKFAGLIG